MSYAFYYACVEYVAYVHVGTQVFLSLSLHCLCLSVFSSIIHARLSLMLFHPSSRKFSCLMYFFVLVMHSHNSFFRSILLSLSLFYFRHLNHLSSSKVCKCTHGMRCACVFSLYFSLLACTLITSIEQRVVHLSPSKRIVKSHDCTQ